MRLIDADELKTHKFLTPQVKVIGGRKNGKTREQIIVNSMMRLHLWSNHY